MVSGDTRIDVSDKMSESNIASGNNLDMKVNLTNVSSVGIVGTGNFGKALKGLSAENFYWLKRYPFPP